MTLRKLLVSSKKSKKKKGINSKGTHDQLMNVWNKFMFYSLFLSDTCQNKKKIENASFVNDGIFHIIKSATFQAFL